KALGLGAAAAAASGCGGLSRGLLGARPAPRPNIVLIMADDMGYSDIGCYGGEIRTPNLDRLADNGLRFTQFYNTGRCCPTRASLLTGLYPHQAGVGHMMGDQGLDGFRGDLNRECVTIAETLREAGYGTYMSGKWHVTKHTKPNSGAEKFNWPLQRGFDRFFGTITGAGDFWGPATLTRDNTPIEAPKEGFYYTDAISDTAIEFINDHVKARPDDPFFAYVAYTAPHWPLHAPKADVDRYRGKYMMGWDRLREERHARMIEMGIVDAAWPMTPRDETATSWDEVDEEKRQDMDWRMAVYAAMIDIMDQGVGRIVSTLKTTGRLDNTLIFFLSDNGGCAEGGPWGFGKMATGDHGENRGHSSYGLSWANASNTPFRRYKHWVHEGGIATPLIVHWPSRVRARGALRRQPGHLIDVMATCVDVSGAAYPSEREGHRIQPMEGRSLVSAFDDRPIEREALYWEHEGNCAVRILKWKLVSQHRQSFWQPGVWELYDLEADRTELHDLSKADPNRVEQMARQWRTWARRANALPWPRRN
ncbi:MAG TPA: arylsulfatase, partial [Sumerlaeia bacterium]|nr:arylsulfatase [Sumerlaeia bacterium]